jgi:AIPR protein
MAPTPDQVIAKDAFAAFKSANYPKLSDGDAFERFAMSQIALRRFGLSVADINSGLVGASNDGGIDGFYVFLNGQELVKSDSVRLSRRQKALDGLQRGLTLDVVVVQAKSETKWDTNVLPKIESALKALLAHDVTAASLRAFPFNEDLVEKALDFHKLRQKLSMLVPVINFSVQYVTFAEYAKVDTYMETKRAQLQQTLADRLPSGSEVTVDYVGDVEAVKRLRLSNDFSAKMIFAKAPVRLGTALVGLVKLADYIDFLHRDDTAALREELFAANVRDFAGAGIGVNGAIAKTLETDTATEFWWLNNGITVIADDAADPIELEWVLTNPLIVNGLQTSNMIHSASNAGKITRARLEETVLVRLVKESNPQVREAIIAGTNNQTAVASIQLHANEEKQLRIEEYLRHANWFYERRRFQYRGTTTPAGRIRTVTELAQAVMSFRLLEPETARARPSSLLGNSPGWSKVFDDQESEELFLKALNTSEVVDAYLGTSAAKQISDDATNTRYYLVAGYSLRASNVKSLSDFNKLPSTKLKATPSHAILGTLHKVLQLEVGKLDDGKIAIDKIFKGPRLKPAYFNRILKLNAK